MALDRNWMIVSSLFCRVRASRILYCLKWLQQKMVSCEADDGKFESLMCKKWNTTHLLIAYTALP